MRVHIHKSGAPMDFAMSAFPSKADIRAGLQHICFVPNMRHGLLRATKKKSRPEAALNSNLMMPG